MKLTFRWRGKWFSGLLLNLHGIDLIKVGGRVISIAPKEIDPRWMGKWFKELGSAIN